MSQGSQTEQRVMNVIEALREWDPKLGALDDFVEHQRADELYMFGQWGRVALGCVLHAQAHSYAPDDGQEMGWLGDLANSRTRTFVRMGLKDQRAQYAWDEFQEQDSRIVAAVGRQLAAAWVRYARDERYDALSPRQQRSDERKGLRGEPPQLASLKLKGYTFVPREQQLGTCIDFEHAQQVAREWLPSDEEFAQSKYGRVNVSLARSSLPVLLYGAAVMNEPLGRVRQWLEKIEEPETFREVDAVLRWKEEISALVAWRGLHDRPADERTDVVQMMLRSLMPETVPMPAALQGELVEMPSVRRRCSMGLHRYQEIACNERWSQSLGEHLQVSAQVCECGAERVAVRRQRRLLRQTVGLHSVAPGMARQIAGV